MIKTLILYASVHGHTIKVCQAIEKQLTALGESVTICALDQAPDLNEFDKILLGANIRHGKHHPSVEAFLVSQQALLQSKINGFFSVNLVARKPAKNTPETNPYVRTFLEQLPWQPQKVGVFAGRLSYPNYNFFDRLAIRFIMWITKGPTDPTVDIEFTNWQAVDQFAQEFHQLQLPQA